MGNNPRGSDAECFLKMEYEIISNILPYDCAPNWPSPPRPELACKHTYESRPIYCEFRLSFLFAQSVRLAHGTESELTARWRDHPRNSWPFVFATYGGRSSLNYWLQNPVRVYLGTRKSDPKDRSDVCRDSSRIVALSSDCLQVISSLTMPSLSRDELLQLLRYFILISKALNPVIRWRLSSVAVQIV